MEILNCRLYKNEEHRISKWSGGTTAELAIWPASSAYLQRDFLWRLSSAEVELPESDFTRLPDYDRVLLVLSGEVVLAHEGERAIRLSELEQDRFDGAYKTKSFGQITDYNLMVKKGNQGFLEMLALSEENKALCLEDYEEYDSFSVGFYCHTGYVLVTAGGETCMVRPGEQLVINGRREPADSPADEPVNGPAGCGVSYMGEGKTVFAKIYYKAGTARPEEIPAQKGTLADFGAAMKLSLTNFRGSKYIFKALRSVWYDRALQKGMARIERFYLPFFIGIFGLAACAICVFERWGAGWMAAAMAIWLLFHCLFLSPLLYFLSCPKPINAHIKRLDSLTEYEQKLYEQEQKENPRVESLLKKYKISGRNKYID